jgi:hypothetical protein
MIRYPACFVLILMLLLTNGAVAEMPIPRHLELGRVLLTNLAPNDTSYMHKGFVRWKGDFFVSRYEAHTDCSGLINSLLERAESPSIGRLRIAAIREPQAKDYYDLISREDGFKRIDSVSEVLPGDIIAVKYLTGHAPPKDSSTGHIMLVDERPSLRKSDTRPIVDGTKQWEVTIIDSTKSHHGKNDTRYGEDGSKRDGGVGRGIFRLYSNEQEKPMGFSWSIEGSSQFYDASKRPIVIGRPIVK